jgi:hypothetical protein
MPLQELRRTLQGVDTLPPASQQNAIGTFVDAVVAELPQLTSRTLTKIGKEVDQLRGKVGAVLAKQERTPGAYNVDTALEIVRKMIDGFCLLALGREKAAVRDRMQMEEVDTCVLRCLLKAWEDHSGDERIKDGLTVAVLRVKVDALMPQRDVTEADILLSLETLERQERVGKGPQEQVETEGEEEVRYIIHSEGMSSLEALPVPGAKSAETF